MQPGARPRVELVGPLHVDLFMRGSAPLERDELNAWVGPSDVDLVVAGSMGYTALAFARLDWDVEAHSTVGTDAFGDHIEQTLSSRGIDTRFVRRADGQTAIAIYPLLFGGSKRPMTYRLPDFEPWADPPLMMRDDEDRPDLVVSSGLLHFPQMWHRGLSATLEAARAAGVLTALDPQFPLSDTPAPWQPHLADVLRHTDVLLCDEREAQMIFGTPDLEAAVQAAHECGPSIVVVKRGAAGSRISDLDTAFEQPAVPLPDASVREAVGAGDAFDAGFLDKLARGGPIAEAARHGTATAALSLAGLGGAEGIADREAVEKALSRVPPATSQPSARKTGANDDS